MHPKQIDRALDLLESFLRRLDMHWGGTVHGQFWFVRDGKLVKDDEET